MARPKIVSNEIYHIYNKGVDGRKIFLGNSDYFRFIHDLFEFNTEESVINLNYHFCYKHKSILKETLKAKGNLLIDIFAFCLMPNHFHLMVRQRIDGGISKFMQKLGTGYTNYFNTKFERDGALFQGKYKAILINQEAHFIYLPHYIHLNPLDLTNISWREKKINNVEKALEFLRSYRWSTYLDYTETKNFPSVTQRKFLLDFFNGEKGYKESFANWLKTIELKKIKEVVIE